jgi:NADPH:quinone reductase-like Zn-dependent oxidoreductase
VRSLGADETVNYQDQDVFEVMQTAGKTFDIIYDTVGAGVSVWEGAAAGALAKGGHLITITGDIQRNFDLTDLLSRGYQIVTRSFYCLLFNGGGGYHQYTQPGGSQADLIVLDTLVREGKLKGVVDRTYNFELSPVKEAFKYLMTGHARGKVVINVKA